MDLCWVHISWISFIKVVHLHISSTEFQALKTQFFKKNYKKKKTLENSIMLLCEPFPRWLFQALSNTYNLKDIATLHLILQKVSNRISFNDKKHIVGSIIIHQMATKLESLPKLHIVLLPVPVYISIHEPKGPQNFTSRHFPENLPWGESYNRFKPSPNW